MWDVGEGDPALQLSEEAVRRTRQPRVEQRATVAPMGSPVWAALPMLRTHRD